MEKKKSQNAIAQHFINTKIKKNTVHAYSSQTKKIFCFDDQLLFFVFFFCFPVEELSAACRPSRAHISTNL